MCEFCEQEKNLKLHRQYTDTNIQEIYIHTAKDGAALFIRQPMWKLEDENGVDKMNVRLSTDLAYLDIKYCPLCGRELKYIERNKYKNFDIKPFKF